MAQRLLLCRPLGGLNDMLCQIERCCAYADRFGRTVVVDTRDHSDRYRDDFSRYFSSLRQNLVLDDQSYRHLWDTLPVEPAFLAGRVRGSRPYFDPESRFFVDAETKRPVTFDFERDYEAPLVVHHQPGGGVLSIEALAKLRLAPELAGVLRARLAAIGPRYDGIHIRDTDYQARYKNLLGKVPVGPTERIFVATDNASALDACRAAFGAERVYSFAALPAEPNPLHHIEDPALAYRRNADSILDLLMLALSSTLHLFQLEPNRFNAPLSGYSTLASNLNLRRALVAKVIGDGQ
ncbi:MAG TPA: hypothetical protein VKT30_07030 [Caulobacteraceae bacterium]|nr:hypothetical protein [Caulobacteraceae bacterium]